MKKLYDKMVDFNRYGLTLVIISVILFVGSLMPQESGSEFIPRVLLTATMLFLTLAYSLFTKAIDYKQILEENEDEEFTVR